MNTQTKSATSTVLVVTVTILVEDDNGRRKVELRRSIGVKSVDLDTLSTTELWAFFIWFHKLVVVNPFHFKKSFASATNNPTRRLVQLFEKLPGTRFSFWASHFHNFQPTCCAWATRSWIFKYQKFCVTHSNISNVRKFVSPVNICAPNCAVLV